jgi:sortase A
VRVLAGLGRFLVTAGILILLFVAYQLWGTGLYTDREQNRLRDEFISELSDEDTSASTTTSTGPSAPTTTTTTPTAPPPPPTGEAIAQIRIPKIGLDSIVINGVTRSDLRKGPGHYPDTPLPGQRGNSAIAGHRTTYGSPFANLDQLASGDTIVVRTTEGVFEFRVNEKRVVNPSDIGVLEPTKEDPADPASELAATLTLTTCEPKYSAAQRLVIKAELKADEVPLPAPELREAPQLSEEGLSGEESSKLPTIISGVIAVLIGLLWWLVFHRHPRWTNWIVGAIPFAVALFFFYSFLERVLPANY